MILILIRAEKQGANCPPCYCSNRPEPLRMQGKTTNHASRTYYKQFSD